MPLGQTTLCEALADQALGPSAGQEPIRPEFINSLLYPSGSQELAHNLQAIGNFGGYCHRYDLGPVRNQLAYGQQVPPLYNSSTIKFRRMSFYVRAAWSRPPTSRAPSH